MSFSSITNGSGYWVCADAMAGVSIAASAPSKMVDLRIGNPSGFPGPA